MQNPLVINEEVKSNNSSHKILRRHRVIQNELLLSSGTEAGPFIVLFIVLACLEEVFA